MPIMTRRLPISRALASAELRLSLIACSRSAIASPSSWQGGTLISRLNCPTSVAQVGSAMASSTSALRMDGAPSESTRFSSISWPTFGVLAPNACSRSIRANTSSDRRTLSRYVRLSAPLNVIGAMSRPISPRSARGRCPPLSVTDYTFACHRRLAPPLWPLRVQGAVSAEQAGLVRCYLRDLAQRDATDLMAVAGQHGHSLTALPALRPVRRRISWTILSYFD